MIKATEHGFGSVARKEDSATMQSVATLSVRTKTLADRVGGQGIALRLGFRLSSMPLSASRASHRPSQPRKTPACLVIHTRELP